MNTKKAKEEHGSVTLFVLISMLFFIPVLLNIYMTSANKNAAQKKQLKDIESAYTSTNIQQIYEETISNN